MKVAILTDSFPPYISGVSTYCVSLAKELIKKGHKVLIMAPKDENNVIPHGLEKAKIVRLPSFSSPPSITTLRFCLPNTSLVTRKIKAFKADIIEIEGPTFLGIDGLLASKILNIPCVSTFHTFTTSKEYLQLIFKIKSRNLERISWAYHRWFYNSGNFVFATTPKMLKIMAKNGIKKSKMSPITLLFDFERVNFLNEQEKATLKKFYGLKKNVAVFLGRISKEKNLDTLIKIWAGVIKKNPNSTLLIIGGGPYEKRIKKLIAKLKIGSNVVLTGVIENERLLKSGLLSICDVFVSASISETFGLTGIEAMASNLPVILFKSQGVSEIVDNAGFVIKQKDKVAFQNAILKIFEDEKLKKRMGSKARKIAARYDSRKAVTEMIGKYETIIKKHKPSKLSLVGLMNLEKRLRSKINVQKYKNLLKTKLQDIT